MKWYVTVQVREAAAWRRVKSEGLGYAETVKESEVLIDGVEEVKSMLCGRRTGVARVRSIDTRTPIIVLW